MRRTRSPACCASSTASGPAIAAATTAASEYQTSRSPAGTVKGASSSVKDCRPTPQRATGTLTASTASSAAPVSVRRSATASQATQPMAAASIPPREEASARPSTSRASVPHPAARRARCGELASQSAAGAASAA